MQRRKRKLLRSAPYNRGARVHNCHCLSHLAELETECNDDKKQALQTLRRTLTTDHVNALQTIHHEYRTVAKEDELERNELQFKLEESERKLAEEKQNNIDLTEHLTELQKDYAQLLKEMQHKIEETKTQYLQHQKVAVETELAKMQTDYETKKKEAAARFRELQVKYANEVDRADTLHKKLGQIEVFMNSIRDAAQRIGIPAPAPGIPLFVE